MEKQYLSHSPFFCILLLKPWFTWNVPRIFFFSLLCNLIVLTLFSQILRVQLFILLIMWHGNLATAVCLCRYVKWRLERKRIECGEGVEGRFMKERCVGWKIQQPQSLVSKLVPAWWFWLWIWLISGCAQPQAVWRWIGLSLLDSGIPLPPVFCPGPSTERVNRRGAGPERSKPTSSSEPPGHLPWCPVWELLLPGQSHSRKTQHIGLVVVIVLVNREKPVYSQKSAFKNPPRTLPELVLSVLKFKMLKAF